MSDKTTAATTSATTTSSKSTEPTESAQPIMTTETVIDALLESLSYSSYTAYRIATIINAAQTILQLDRKPIEPQRIYQSAKNGQIDGVKHVKVSDVSFTSDQVKAFAIKWIEKTISSQPTSSRVEMKSLIAAASLKLNK